MALGEERKFKEIKSKSKIFTKLNFQVDVVVEDDMPSKVDPAGYVDPNIRIAEMIKAGIRIDEWNKAMYDYENYEENEDDGRYVNDDIYDDENEIMRKGKISMESYRAEIYRQYSDYIKNQNEAAQRAAMDVSEEKNSEAVKNEKT